MNTITNKPEQISIVIPFNRHTKLIDRRIRTNGIIFGTIDEVAKNLGIVLKDGEKGLVATAPKLRLQLFVERLHFSGVHYSAV